MGMEFRKVMAMFLVLALLCANVQPVIAHTPNKPLGVFGSEVISPPLSISGPSFAYFQRAFFVLTLALLTTGVRSDDTTLINISLGEPKTAIALLEKGLTSQDLKVFDSSVLRLRDMRFPKIKTPHLGRIYLEPMEPELRLVLIKAIWTHDIENKADLILTSLDDQNDTVRKESARLLERIADADMTPKILDRLRRESAWRVLKVLSGILVKVHGSDYLEKLLADYFREPEYKREVFGARLPKQRAGDLFRMLENTPYEEAMLEHLAAKWMQASEERKAGIEGLLESSEDETKYLFQMKIRGFQRARLIQTIRPLIFVALFLFSAFVFVKWKPGAYIRKAA